MFANKINGTFSQKIGLRLMLVRKGFFSHRNNKKRIVFTQKDIELLTVEKYCRLFQHWNFSEKPPFFFRS